MELKGSVLRTILLSLPLLWLPAASLSAAGQPRLPRSSIPADASDRVKKQLLRLYSPYADRKAQALADLGDLAEEAAPAVPFLIGMADCCSTEGKQIKQAIVRIGAAAVDPLLSALGDPDRQVRTAAVWVLGELKDPRAVTALAGLLRDGERMVREEAAKALGASGQASAIEPLFSALRDGDVMMQQYSAKALGMIGAPALARAIDLLKDPDVDQRRYAAWILGDLKDPRAVEPIAAALRNHTDDATDRDVYETVMALAKIGSAATESLLALAHHGSAAVRRESLYALGTMKDPRALPLFLSALQDADYEVLAKAVEALGKLKDSRAVEPLIPILRDPRPGFRIAAAEALGAIGDGRAVERLIDATKDSEGLVRMTAARALGHIKDLRALEPLCAALEDQMPEVREEAAKALAALPDSRAVKPLIAALGDESSDVRRHAIEALLRIGAPAFDPLLAALQDARKGVRAGAVLALGAFKDARAVEPLIPALQDPESPVRYSAAYALGEIKDPRALEPLLAALHDPVLNLTVVAALVKLKDPRAVEPLLALLEDSHKRGSGSASDIARELKKMGEVLVEPLVSAFARSQSRARSMMADMLGDLKDRRAIAPLVAALGTQDPAVQEHAAAALVKIGSPAVEPLIAAVKTTEGLAFFRDARGVAALGEIGGPEACRFLVDLRARSDRPGFGSENGTLSKAIDRAECLPIIDRRESGPEIRPASR